MSDPLSEFDDILATLNQLENISTLDQSPSATAPQSSLDNATTELKNKDSSVFGPADTLQVSALSPTHATLPPPPKEPSLPTVPSAVLALQNVLEEHLQVNVPVAENQNAQTVSTHPQQQLISDPRFNDDRVAQRNKVVQVQPSLVCVAPAAKIPLLEPYPTPLAEADTPSKLVRIRAQASSIEVQDAVDQTSVRQAVAPVVATPVAQASRPTPVSVGTHGLASTAQKLGAGPNSPTSPSHEAGTLGSCFPKGWRDQTFADPVYTNWRRGMIQHLESLPDHGCMQIPSLFPVLASLADQLAAKNGHGPSS
ncbi:hypothetical protein BCR44DRAFT_1169626 [Catenaria anguillulae PL171]|uniref:Uncharacterized protein n=1 Tax=Catenaria anguillulae PL171 TaxID=765915 RepID=A0A1Y2HZX0_9FUNG|nr:hypothetical protein BCR44DRAFT_1169626 [Catenaria anguillulae PL171]